MKRDGTIWFLRNDIQNVEGIYTNLRKLLQENDLAKLESSIRKALGEGYPGITVSRYLHIENRPMNTPAEKQDRSKYFLLLPR